MNYLERIFLWIGNTSKPQEEFDDYFKIDYTEGTEKKICGFCRDINKEWYDEDFIGYLKFEEAKPIVELLEFVPINKSQSSLIIEKCKELGYEKANSTYWYSAEMEEPDKNKLYNELNYIGEFDLD
jgi:hypothetical protein